MRHQLILKWISSIYKVDDKFTVLDFGAAQGKLSSEIAKKVRNKQNV